MRIETCKSSYQILVLLLCSSLVTAQNAHRAFHRNYKSSAGFLNTFRNLTRWSSNERELYTLVKSLIESRPCGNTLREPYLWINANSYTEDFEGSTLIHLQGLKRETEIKTGSILEMEDYDKLVASNLVLVYWMTHRFAKYGEALQDLVSENLESEDALSCSPNVQHLFKSRWPETRENDMTITTLLSAYGMYDMFINPDSFAKVLSPETTSPANITAEMAFAVGEMAIMVKHYVQAIDWLNFAGRLVGNEGDTSISWNLLHDTKENAIYRHNIDIYHGEYPETSYTKLISVADSNTPKESQKWIRRKDVDYNYYKGWTHNDYSSVNMWALCGREELQAEKVKARLKCYLDTKKHPWLTVNPLRVEVLADSPAEIFLFHDILGEELTTTIVETLEDSDMSVSFTGDIVMEESSSPTDFFWRQLRRTSVSTWITDTTFPKLKKISEVVTGLILSPEWGNSEILPESEQFQAVEYTVGRYYTAHTDVHPAQIETPELYNWTIANGGIRTATLLFYLNDVEKGGETVFTNAGAIAAPKRGSAVFWSNVFKNGTMRLDTSHASCPVLYGRKLVINKWFRSNNQIRAFPCSLNQLE